MVTQLYQTVFANPTLDFEEANQSDSEVAEKA